MLAKVPEANRIQHEALLKERADVVNDCKVFRNRSSPPLPETAGRRSFPFSGAFISP